MNRTTWTGRISRGYLVLPLAESTMDLHPVVQALSRWASPKTEILQPFWSAIPMLDAHWRSFSVTQALQQDPPRGCKDPGGSCSSKLPSIHWPAGSCSVPGAGLHQVSISSFLQPLLSWTLNCWLFEPDGSPMWNCTGPPVAASTTPMANHPPACHRRGGDCRLRLH